MEATLENVLILGLLVLIRTFLSWSLVLEVEGKWPGNPADRQPARVNSYSPRASTPAIRRADSRLKCEKPHRNGHFRGRMANRSAVCVVWSGAYP